MLAKLYCALVHALRAGVPKLDWGRRVQRSFRFLAAGSKNWLRGPRLECRRTAAVGVGFAAPARGFEMSRCAYRSRMWMRNPICTQIISTSAQLCRITPGRWRGEISTPQCALSICVQFGLFVQDAPETRPMGTGEGGRICHPGAGGVSCAPQPCPAPGGLTFREPPKPGTPPWVDIRRCTIPTLRPLEPPPQSARPHSDACPGGAWLALSRAQRPCVPHCAFTPRRRRSCRRRSRRTGPWSGRCRPRRWGTAR